MTPDLLRELGELLYGKLWQSELARQHGVNDRRVRAWIAEERPIPEGLQDELVTALRARRDAMTAMLRKLS